MLTLKVIAVALETQFHRAIVGHAEAEFCFDKITGVIRLKDKSAIEEWSRMDIKPKGQGKDIQSVYRVPPDQREASL